LRNLNLYKIYFITKHLFIGSFWLETRILGLDVGDARVGVAISDPLGITAQPLTTLEGTTEEVIGPLLDLVSHYMVSVIVVGFPYELSGKIGPQAEKVSRFKNILENALSVSSVDKPIKIVLWDERLTTQQAKEAMQGSKLKNKQASAALDRISASILLSSYLTCSSRG
jgi:putative Holliday junction resolvase